MYFICRFLLYTFIGIGMLSCAGVEAGVTSLTPGECKSMQLNGVITPSNPVGCERLSRVTFQYINFTGATAMGNIVVLDAVAEQTEAIFSELFLQGFSINKALVMENYQGNDDAAMADNNTSAFNGRAITGGSGWSKHAYGVAIDLNPVQNPYIALSTNGSAQVLPPASAKTYVNRRNIRPNKTVRTGMVEEVVEIFARHGFMTWGGEYDFPIDYQHFEIGTLTLVNQLITQTPEAARQTYSRYAQGYRDCAASSRETDPIKKRVACVEKVRQ